MWTAVQGPKAGLTERDDEQSTDRWVFWASQDILVLRVLGGASGKEPACQCRRHKRHRFDPWVRKIP